MMRPARLALLTCVLLAFPSPLSALGWSAAKNAEAKALIARFLGPASGQFAGRAPALSYAIGIDGTGASLGAFGEAAPGQPASADTLYRIGSLTKQLTAAAVLKLIEDGAVAQASDTAITLDTHITKILGEAARWTQPDQPPITVRSLLTMTSNLPNFTRRPPDHFNPWGSIEAHKLLDEVRQLAPSGWPSSFEYSNTNYFLLSAIIDAVKLPQSTTRGYFNVLQKLVFAPAGMKRTGFAREHGDTPGLAAANYKRKPAFAAPDWLRGSGDVVSSAADILAWNNALIAGQVISKPSLAIMLSESARVTPTDFYGMGWFISKSGSWNVYSHTGSVPGYTSYNAVVRDAGGIHSITVTLLTNVDGVKDLEILADDLVRLAMNN